MRRWERGEKREEEERGEGEDTIHQCAYKSGD
jgi:hypothetical protein